MCAAQDVVPNNNNVDSVTTVPVHKLHSGGGFFYRIFHRKTTTENVAGRRSAVSSNVESKTSATTSETEGQRSFFSRVFHGPGRSGGHSSGGFGSKGSISVNS